MTSDPMRHYALKTDVVKICVLLAVGLISLGLALRRIPSIYASNDTGRYLVEYWSVCASGLPRLAEDGVSWLLFGAVLSVFCWDESARLFLFISVLIVPLSFLVFSERNTQSYVLVLAVLGSVYGFELGTNALRQALSIAVLIPAYRLAVEGRILSCVAVAVLAAALHYSSVVFVPLVLLVATLQFRLVAGKTLFSSFAIAVAALLALALLVLGFSGQLIEFISGRLEWYVEQSSRAFLLFLGMPIVAVSLILGFPFKDRALIAPTIVLIYGSAIFALAVVVAPAIAFRFAFGVFVLVVFSYACSSRVGVARALLVLAVCAAHLALYFTFSPHARSVIFG